MATTTVTVNAPPPAPRVAPKRRALPDPWLKPGIFWGGLVPLAAVLYRFSNGSLGANPIAEAENQLGLTALIFLVASLMCTPARRLFGWTWTIRVRKELGLFAFFYASMHFLTYVLLDQGLDLAAIFADVLERPFISVGFIALVLLVPIAITSTNGWVKRLGYMRWLRLHQLVYVVLGLVCLHFFWRVKIDISQPLAYSMIAGSLLGIRLLFWVRAKRAAARKAAAKQNAVGTSSIGG
jgi:methionine sulfoxide reductase heme-binding subunit